MEHIKILVVDDHPMMREALKMALNEEIDMEVVAEASDGLEAIAQAAQHHPDVILMDLLMPGMDGLQVIEQIARSDPQQKMMVVSSIEDDNRILAAIQAGALGYFPKSAPRDYLLEAIRKVADGIPYLPAGIAQKLFKTLREMKMPPTIDKEQEPLTSRQLEILALIGEGRSDQEIANILHLEAATVRSHVHHILQRLGLESRTQAVAYVHRTYKKE